MGENLVKVVEGTEWKLDMAPLENPSASTVVSVLNLG